MADDATTTQDTTPTPPWGSDEDFNPSKAWTLIKNLREENAQHKDAAAQARAHAQDLTTKLDALTAERDAAATTATDLQARLDAEAAARTKDRLLTRAGLDPDKYARLLVGDTEEEWASVVNDLAPLATTTPRPDPAQRAEPATDARAALAAEVFGD